MASEASDHNIDNKGKKKYKFKKLRTVGNMIGFRANNQGNDSYNPGDDNQSGCQNFNLPATSNIATDLLKTNTPQVRKRFFKTSEKNIFTIKENRFEKGIIKCTEWV